MYAVIRVDQCYDYVESAECLSSYETEQEANDAVRKLKEEQNVSRLSRIQYINGYVDSMEIPDTDYQGWLEYLKQFYPFGVSYVFPKDFKKEFKSYLISGHTNNLKDYNPPKTIRHGDNLFVVEIKK